MCKNQKDFDKKQEDTTVSLRSGLFYRSFSSDCQDRSFKKGNAKIVIMRHAQTIWNEPRKRIQGQSPSVEITLSTRGKKDIMTTMDRSKIPDLILLSPLHRCIQTVETWFGTQLKQITTPTVFIDGLKEVNAGKLEGLYVDELSGELENVWQHWVLFR